MQTLPSPTAVQTGIRQFPRVLPAILILALCLVILVAAVLVASLVQTDFGRVEVTNVTYPNYNGIPIRAKLFRPLGAAASSRLPGVVYIHGYQNNRETSDPYAIELARRGVVVLSIDAIGRGNSGIPNDVKAPDFDKTYGGLSSFQYLQSLPFVNPNSVGMMGHSLGAEMAYAIALKEPAVKALSISGYAYTLDATASSPSNMLMIFGKWDEYRERMTGTRDFEKEWMNSPQTIHAVPVSNAQLNTTYGDMVMGTARRVYMARTVHLGESHSEDTVAEAVAWMTAALQPPASYRLDPVNQIWPIKEWATLIAMLAGFASLLPLGWLLLQTRPFAVLQGQPAGDYAQSGKPYLRFAAINGVVMWLYLPLVLLLFAFHVYVIPIDKVFPMMLVNGVVWWFLIINLIGLWLFRRWFQRQAQPRGTTLAELGISFRKGQFALDWPQLGRTFLLAVLLFAFAYLCESVLESIFIVDYRFIFPFASDLTPYRAWMLLLYFPFLLIAFVFQGVFLHGQMRRPRQSSLLKTFVSWSVSNILVMTVPLFLFLLVQYVPLFVAGIVPFVGPGGMLANYVMQLPHTIGLLILVLPLSTWFYQLTGRIYLGATLNALLVAWVFASAQVIAPIPV